MLPIYSTKNNNVQTDVILYIFMRIVCGVRNINKITYQKITYVYVCIHVHYFKLVQSNIARLSFSGWKY